MPKSYFDGCASTDPRLDQTATNWTAYQGRLLLLKPYLLKRDVRKLHSCHQLDGFLLLHAWSETRTSKKLSTKVKKRQTLFLVGMEIDKAAVPQPPTGRLQLLKPISSREMSETSSRVPKTKQVKAVFPPKYLTTRNYSSSSNFVTN